MRTKIVIITSKYLHPFVQDAFDRIAPDCDIIIVEYANFDHIAELYKKYETIADGFMISGTTAVAAIEHHVGEIRKPFVSFHADMISFYHALITLFLERRDLDPKRCIFDFLLPISEDASVERLIREIDLNRLEMTMNQWAEKSTVGDFSKIEYNIAEKTIEMWKAGQIDMVLCSYSSTIPLLEENGVPYYFLYPVQAQLEAQIQELLAQIQLESFHENLPATIVIMERDSENSKKSTSALRDAIEQIKKEFLMDAILKEENGRYYIFTSNRTVTTITDNFKTGYFSAELLEDYQISVAVAYGIGKSITEAKRHAENALRESLSSGGIYVMDERGNQIGPLNSKHRLAIEADISENICKIAERCKLSTLTIQKLYSIVQMNGSNEMTTNELSAQLDVTIRNANRILRNLESGGAAEIAYTKSTATKGRPVKVYRLNLS